MPKRAPRRRSAAPPPWRALTHVAVVAVVAFTCAPIFERPVLDPDDWRYLSLVKEIDAGRVSPLDAAIVENRWDHLWWLDAPAIVRFFRPIVLLSYWVDAHVWGARVTFGLLATNVLVHLACALVFATLLMRWLGTGVAALLSSALFAALWAHGEAIWYVAGRTDSMAALTCLIALWLHIEGASRPSLRFGAVAVWAVGLLTKETVVALPALVFLHDLWVERRGDGLRRVALDGRTLWIAYAVTGLAVFGLRAVAMEGKPSAPVYPYLVPPTHPAFAGHLWTQARIYAENLLVATESPPFLSLDGLSNASTTHGLVVAIAALFATIVLLRRDRRAWWAAALVVLAWAPASISYVSERYLYLPSVGVALLAGLAIVSLAGKKWAQGFAILVVLVWTGHQAWMLRWKHQQIMVVNLRLGAVVREKLATALDGAPAGHRVLLLNYPGDTLDAQFAEALVRDLTGDPAARARIATLMPRRDDLGTLARVSADGPGTLVVEGPSHQGRTLAAHGATPWIFPAIAHPSSALSREALGFTVEVDGDGGLASKVRVTLPEGLAGWTILRWMPDLSPGLASRERFERGRFERVTP